MSGVSNLRILYVSTCPWINTGYGKCTRYIVSHLRARGFDIELYCPQLLSSPITWGSIPVWPRFEKHGAYDVEPIVYWYVKRQRNLLITHLDVWVLTGLTRYRQVCWVPYCPVDAPLDEYTSEINVVLRSENVLAIIVFTRWAKREVEKIVGDAKQVYVVPHGVDTAIYRPVLDEDEKRRLRRKHNLPEEGFFLLYVAMNLSERKDIPGLLKAFRLFLDEVRDRSCYLLLWTNTGPSPGESFDIIRLVHRYGLENNVFVPQEQPPQLFTDESKMAEIYACADWYVTTSTGEAFGIPVLEAMAVGVPVVANANSAHVELVSDSIDPPRSKIKICKRGILVKPRWQRPTLWTVTHQEYSFVDPADFAEALVLAYNLGPPDWMKHNCIEFARQHDWSRITELFAMVLLEIEPLVLGRS